MMSLTLLQQQVQATLASKRLGRPVFVRFHLQREDRDALGRLTQMTAMVREWISQPVSRVFAVGSIKSGQVALTLEFRDGATALVSWAHGRPRGDGVDLIVLGNHGALYHDAGAANLWDELAGVADAPVEARLQDLIAQALKSGKPEVIPP